MIIQNSCLETGHLQVPDDCPHYWCAARPLWRQLLLMVVEEVEMKSRRNLLQSVAVEEVLLAAFLLVNWEEL